MIWYDKNNCVENIDQISTNVKDLRIFNCFRQSSYYNVSKYKKNI